MPAGKPRHRDRRPERQRQRRGEQHSAQADLEAQQDDLDEVAVPRRDQLQGAEQGFGNGIQDAFLLGERAMLCVSH
jgi:hypothetical protein